MTRPSAPPTSATTSTGIERADVAIIGGGILGLATALQLQRRRPGLRLAVLEKEPGLGLHQSGHNSGVVHAGLYYAPGSLKAALCREGKRELEASPSTMRSRCGIRASSSSRWARRAPAARSAARAGRGERRGGPRGRRGRANPRARAAGGSDPGAVVAANRDRRLPDGRCGACRRDPRSRRDRRDRTTGDGPRRAGRGGRPGHGAWTARRRSGRRLRWPPGRPGRGDERRARPQRAQDRAVPGRLLHAHARRPGPRRRGCSTRFRTRAFRSSASTSPADRRRGVGGAECRPRARPRGLPPPRHRPARRGRDPRIPGLLAARPAPPPDGARRDLAGLVEAGVRRRVATLSPRPARTDSSPGPSGVRAQALAADGTLIDDFSLGGTSRVLHVRNAPSPGATAALAIGRVLAERAIDRFELD